MVKRIVDTKFWTDMQVIDNYSVEDKYFSLYLMTNDKTTQVGIYPLPKKVISFETGFTTDVIQVLLERFSENYGRIVYSEKTQEVTVLASLKYTILKGGRPVSDLLEKELAAVKDSDLIVETYKEMESFWNLSKRQYDKTIKGLFENELSNRGLMFLENENENDKKNDNEINNDNDNVNENDNDNDNEESWATNRGTNREDVEETALLEKYSNYLKKSKPYFEGTINPHNIVSIYYQQMIGEVHPQTEIKLTEWKEIIPQSLILEALNRSTNAKVPLTYAGSIIDNWLKAGVKTYKDVINLDRNHNRNK